MSDWTSINEIMRDLSVAQGRNVPASLQAFDNSARPTMSIEEEPEEAFYKSCGDVDFSKPPDLNLIQEMLTKVSQEEEASHSDVLLSRSLLNPLSLEFVPGRRFEQDIIKKKRERNVAMESILQGLEVNDVKLNGILKNPMNMFKSRCKKKEEIRCITVSTPQPESVTDNRQYTPTKVADDYYRKYVENAKLRKEIKADIWAKAEQKMKEIDERELLRQESPRSSGQSSSEERSASCLGYGFYRVSLSQHRHLSLDSIEDCVVCDVAAKHGYHFDDDECST